MLPVLRLFLSAPPSVWGGFQFVAPQPPALGFSEPPADDDLPSRRVATGKVVLTFRRYDHLHHCGRGPTSTSKRWLTA